MKGEVKKRGISEGERTKTQEERRLIDSYKKEGRNQESRVDASLEKGRGWARISIKRENEQEKMKDRWTDRERD